MRNYSQFYAIVNKTGHTKEELVLAHTNGRTDSLKALSDAEFLALMAALEHYNKVPAGDPMRKKMIALAKRMNWGKDTKTTVQALDKWLLKQKYQKTLMQLDVPQLTVMVAIFEQKVYADYLTALNK